MTQKKTIYVAGGGTERELVAGYIRQLHEQGLMVTYDWTKAPGWSRQNTREQDLAQAGIDFSAVRNADILWLLVPDAKSEGAHFELGVAYTSMLTSARLRTIVVSGPHIYRSHRIFPLLAPVHYETHHEAFEFVCNEARS